MTPETSIVVPAFNAARYLPDAIASVKAQSVDDWELVVVDDGSTDGTVKAAEAFARDDHRIRVIAQSNAGPAAARNRGFEHSSPTSSTLLFLDADDVLLPGALHTLRSGIRTWPHAGVVHGLAEFVDEGGRRIREGESQAWTLARRVNIDTWRGAPLNVSTPTAFWSLLCCNSIQTPGTALVRREAFIDAGGFDPNIRITEDWDLWIRLSEKWPVHLLPELVLQYRLHNESFSANAHARRAAEAIVRRKTLASLGCARRRRAIGVLRIHERSLAFSKLPLAVDSLRRGHLRASALQAAYGARHLVRSFPGMPAPLQ